MLQSRLELLCRDHVELLVVMTLVATTFSCFPSICVTTTIPCCDLTFSSLAELCVATSILCCDTVSVGSHFDSHSNNFFWSSGVCVATTISCRDLTIFPFTKFCVATSIICRDTVSVVS